ncbi:M36 family metallopeptidase [Tumebacillus sp. ITR2]|uniref:M36 family metallopeptidase n=1 Tax=Tumebacillus amylolyticus TaxID=2801339 RepID=A0ABS1JC48_9BACL|nr:M36 family metallopeptidase [Tumebacillus amylolyticus]MBL0387849.1 M36 family metallopeptidase [Tumebacillus amylolyticus]
MKRKTMITAIATAVMMTTVVPAAFAQTGTPTVAAPAAKSVDAQAAAGNALKAEAAKYGFKSDLSDLQLVSTTNTLGGTIVRYQQTVNGEELFTHQVAVTLDNAGQALLVTSDYVPNLTVETIKTKKLTENEAEAKALADLNVTGGASAMNSRKFGYVVENGKAVPAFKVVSHNGEAEVESFVHAENGKVLKKRDLHQNVNGTGKVFNPNPVRTQGSATGLTDNSNRDSTALTNQLKAVTLQGLDGSGYLRGSYVYIKSKANTFSSTNAFNFTRSSSSFEDVMAYYHIDTVQRYIQTLGFTNVNNRAITVNTNASTQDNSWYSPSTKDLTFGTGGVDDAEDAGIIAHEYGHSIQDNQVPGFGATEEGGAMGEGFGDFMGATYEDAVAPNTAFKALIGEWDATSYSSSNPPTLRRLDTTKKYPTNMDGEVHDDGEIWSHGEYDMAQAFGRDVATKIILQSHFSLTPNSGFANGVAAIKAADQALYGGSHLTQLNSIWAARGL